MIPADSFGKKGESASGAPLTRTCSWIVRLGPPVGSCFGSYQSPPSPPVSTLTRTTLSSLRHGRPNLSRTVTRNEQAVPAQAETRPSPAALEKCTEPRSASARSVAAACAMSPADARRRRAAPRAIGDTKTR
eukprot:6210032-Pleurochrysis_carterae.AAC.6